MAKHSLTRRDFLKLASLCLMAAAAPRLPTVLRRKNYCPPQPNAGLSAEQQQRLLAASQSFIAPDVESARQVALDIDFVEGRNEDASTMCGPLAIAILQKAELLGPWARVHDFWLLNPRQNLHPVEYTFPDDQYSWYQFDMPISQFDFSQFPLLAGDLVYLHAGSGDTFEHMLVVNRVDESGRAYTITNFFMDGGTIIEERVLYDPAQPDSGQFKDWADRHLRKARGNTGSGGFRVWRVKDGRSLEFPTDEPNRQLRASLDELFLSAAGTWYADIETVDGPKLYQFNPYEPFHPASTIKIPIAMAFFHWLESQNLTDWESYIDDHGTGGRTFAQLLNAMVVASEENATAELVDFLSKSYLEKTWRQWGLNYTRVEPRRSSATEILLILEKLYNGGWISNASSAHLLNWMATYTRNDETRLGALRHQLPTGSVIYNKRASLVDWPRVVGDSAIIQLSGTAKAVYLVTLHGLGKGKATYENLEANLSQAVEIFGDFLKQVA